MKKLVALCGSASSGKKTIAGVLLTKGWYVAELKDYFENTTSHKVALQRLLAKIQDLDRNVIITGIETVDSAVTIRAMGGKAIFVTRSLDKDAEVTAEMSKKMQEMTYLYSICNEHMYNNSNEETAQAELVKIIDRLFQ